MPKVKLDSAQVRSLQCHPGSRKTLFLDTSFNGFTLEVRQSGGKTFYLRYQDERSRTRYTKLADATHLTVTQAKLLAKKAISKIVVGNDPNETKRCTRNSPLFSTFIGEQYLIHAQKNKKSWKTDLSYLKNHLLPASGGNYLDEITNEQVSEFKHNMHNKGYKVGTCNHCLILLRHVIKLAVKWEIAGVKKNPVSSADLFRDENHINRFLSTEDVNKLFKVLKDSNNINLLSIVSMLLLTGARKREVLDAKWEHINFNQKLWLIPETKSGKPRYIPLSNVLINILNSNPQDGNIWLFLNPKTNLPYQSIFASWDRARQIAGLPNCMMHDLRHSYASFLVNNGRSLYEVQKIFGHSQIKTTQQY